MKEQIQSGFVNPAALEWTRANYGISALSVHERAISMLRVQEQDTPSMKLNVNSGAYSYNGVMHLFIGEESPEFTAPAEGTRLDILYLNGATGALAIQKGTAAVAITDPLELPAVPSGAIPLVAVHLAAEQEAITESDLYDLRAFVMGWAMPDHDHTGDAGDGGVLSTYLRLAYAERRGMMFHDQSLVTAGSGAIARYLTTSQSYGFVAIKASASDGDKFSHGCFLRAGTYTFRALGTTASGRGKLDWYVDGSKITSTPQDWYSGSTVYEVEMSVSSVSIATSGWHKVEGLVNGKNASSSGYAIGLTAFWFVPASD